ncbi:MAG: potassium channel family protein [Ignavibacteriales bacterium]
MNKSRVKSKTFGKIGYIIIVLSLLNAITANIHLDLVNRIIFVFFFVYVAFNLLIGIIKSRDVDSQVIFSAVAAFLLFGFIGAILAAVINLFVPNAFSLNSTYSSQFHQYLYFSFVTITTTGYGDILPITPLARTLAIFLALFGQLYLTVIIGVLIGKYLSSSKQIS